MPPRLREWLPEEHLAWFVLDAVAEMDLAAFLCGLSRRRVGSRGARPGDDGRAVRLRVCDRGALVARDRAALSRGRRVPRDHRQPGARSRDDRALPGPPRGGDRRAVRRGAGAVRAQRAGQGRRRRGRRHEDRGGGDPSRDAQLRADRAGDPRGGRADRRGRGRALRRGARRRAARGAAHERGSAQGAARGQAGAGRRARRAGQEDPARPRRAARSSAGAGCGRTGSSSARSSPSTPPGTRPGSPATGRGGWPARATTSSPIRSLPEPAGKINVTDPDSRNLKTTRGWVQGYNAQAAVGEGQIVVAAEISTESLDTANLQPMVETACASSSAPASPTTPGVVLADAGYWKNDAIEALVGQGIPTLVAPRRRPAQGTAAGPPRRPLRLRPPSPRDRLGQGALPATARDRRARLRPDQVQPRRQPVPAPRQISRQVRMAAADGDPQPAQAPPPPARHRLTGGEPAARQSTTSVNPPGPAPSAGGAAPAGRSPFCDTLREKRQPARRSARFSLPPQRSSSALAFLVARCKPRRMEGSVRWAFASAAVGCLVAVLGACSATQEPASPTP